MDERGASYRALGYSKATGKPAVLVCTSGTALANYMPAVVEAKKSCLPLIVLSADGRQSLLSVTTIKPLIKRNFLVTSFKVR